MASTVTRFSQRSPVTRIIGYSFLLPVIGATATFTLSDCTASIGHRPSVRTIRATRTMCTSIQASSAGAATSGISAPLFVLSQNKNKVGSAVRCSEVSKPWGCKASARHPRQTLAKPETVGEADKNAMTKQETYKSEQSNDKDIVLYPEGKFYKAYPLTLKKWRYFRNIIQKIGDNLGI